MQSISAVNRLIDALIILNQRHGILTFLSIGGGIALDFISELEVTQVLDGTTEITCSPIGP